MSHEQPYQEHRVAMSSFLECLSRSKAYIAVIWLQFGYAGMAIIAKFALNQGLNNYSFVVYRHVVATIAIAPFALIFERKVRPKMTFGIFSKIFLLALLEPVIDQNLYYVGMKYTTATFVTALCNILPAFTFIMAWIFRMEKVNLRTVISQAKVGGTMLTLAGAMLMTLVKGPMLGLPWSGASNNGHTSIIPTPEDQIKGAVMITIGCVCWACFIILQATTLQSYPAELSLTALICVVGAIQNLVLALAMEWGNTSIWIIHFDSKMLAIAYSGIIRTGVTYYIQAIILRQRGPVFITAFNPLGMVIVAATSSFILSEQLFVGSVIGAAVIVVGLYLVLWGKSRDHQKLTSESILPIEFSQASMQKLELNRNLDDAKAMDKDEVV